MKRITKALTRFTTAGALSLIFSPVIHADHMIDPSKELLITNLSVVEDPIRTQDGLSIHPDAAAWTFGELIKNLAGDHDPSEFVVKWLRLWAEEQQVNGRTVDARARMDEFVLQPWIARSGGLPLDFSESPFILLAIVNRIDLHDLEEQSAGEGRFVFGLTNDFGFGVEFGVPFTVIFEYDMPANNELELHKWAHDWHDLGQLDINSETYKSKLTEITRRFSDRGAALDQVNQSALKQIRTNEIFLAAFDETNGAHAEPWEFRQFELNDQGFLYQTPLEKTPHESLNGSRRVGNYIRQHAEAIMSDKYQLRPRVEAGTAIMPEEDQGIEPVIWNFPDSGIDNEVRHRFALNTCNGCHFTEAPAGFMHVTFRSPAQESFLSPFLIGGAFPDPVTGEVRQFNELERRVTVLEQLLHAP